MEEYDFWENVIDVSLCSFCLSSHKCMESPHISVPNQPEPGSDEGGECDGQTQCSWVCVVLFQYGPHVSPPMLDSEDDLWVETSVSPDH